MSTYIRAVVAAKAIADKYGIPLGDLTGLTGKGEEFYKAVDDFVANESEKRRLEMEAEK